MGAITKRTTKRTTKPATSKKTSVKKTDSHSHTHDIHGGLHAHFGFEQFKGGQEEAIHSLLSGCDTFVIMPTGGGKSLCYQLPAMIMEGCAIIVSPLIALM